MRDGALQAAVDLIARQGFAATSMAQVAEAAGISPSGLTHHFPSKQALLGAVLDHRDAMDTFPVEEGTDHPWGEFDYLVLLARSNMQRHQLVLLYMTMIGEAATPSHPAHEWMLRHYSAVLETLVSRMRTDQRLGHVREDAPCERIARETVALMDGLQVQWLLDPEVDMAGILGSHIDVLKKDWGTGTD